MDFGLSGATDAADEAAQRSRASFLFGCLRISSTSPLLRTMSTFGVAGAGVTDSFFHVRRIGCPTQTMTVGHSAGENEQNSHHIGNK